MSETLTKALKRAYSLGQEYWRLADSESYSHNKRAAATEAKFKELIEETARDLELENEELKKELLEAMEAMIEWDAREEDHAIGFYDRMDLCKLAFDKARGAVAKAKGTV